MLRPSNTQPLSPAGKRRAARARAKLAQALEPYLPSVVDMIINETVEDLRGWLRDDALTAILDERMTSVRQVQAEVTPRDMTNEVRDEIIAEEVAAQVPSLVEEFLRAAADAYLMQRRSEMAYEAIYDAIEAEMPSLVEEAFVDAKSEMVFDALDAVEALAADVAPEALEEVAQHAERDRKAAAEKAVRETCETHVLRTASLRHLAGALGANSTSLEVYHYLSLRATALQVGRLDDALRRCVSLRDRLQNEPLLADGYKAALADAGVELLQAQVQNALAAEEAALQRAEDEAYGRIQMAPAPAPYSSVALAPAPAPTRMARAYSSASELG
jgi:hypothetical protein